ncbi:MAG: hypothetical protein O7D30_09885, partial [Rickettsia endosymbiont of Ixodes persulcatus]|nr:hypothetical protein [Rickettsia endosymbiont of Ixodes persulcatus]
MLYLLKKMDMSDIFRSFSENHGVSTQEGCDKPPLEKQPLIDDSMSGQRAGHDQLTFLAETKANQAYIQKIITEKYKYMHQLNLFDQLEANLGQAAMKHLQELEELKSQADYNLPPKDIYGFWITVSPPHDTEPLQQLLKLGKDLSKLAGTAQYMYVIEQKGETQTTLGDHVHLHALLQRNNTIQSGEPRRFEKQIENTIKKIFKKCNPKVLPQKIGTEHVRIKYMLGQKKK